MRELEAVWKSARSDLILTIPEGGTDVFLWEHSVRVAKCAHYLAQLPGVPFSPDLTALLAASLYHDSGWISHWRTGEIERFEILLGSTTDSLLTESERIMRHSLTGVLSQQTLELASAIIRFRSFHSGSGPYEGMLLLEADNLDEFGLGFLWTAIRRGLCGGKGVQAVLDAWTRRVEYHFWTARLKNAFYFEPIRRLAESRLQYLQNFINEMTSQHQVEDVRRVVEVARGSPVPPIKWPQEYEKPAKHKG